jgi:hypothetical protein
MFNVLVTWSAAFRVPVVYLDGRAKRFAAPGERTPMRLAQTTPVPGCEQALR